MRFDSPTLGEKQERDGRLTVVFLLILFLLVFQQIPHIDTLGLNINYLDLTPEKRLCLRDEENTPILPELLPLCYYPFFFLPLPVNSADKELLMTMKGVGPTLAESIVQYRQNNDVISNIDDLQKIPGIGRKRAAALAKIIIFEKAE